MTTTTEAHERGTKQAPGWWPALVQATCSCGWTGPVRDTNNDRERLLLKHCDHNDHLDALGLRDTEEYDDCHPDNWGEPYPWENNEVWER